MRVPSRLAGVLIAALLLLAGVALLLHPWDGDVQNPQAAGAQASKPPSDEAAPAPDETPAATSSAAPPASDSANAAAPERVATDEASSGVDLLLIDALTKKPRDDAAVWYVDPGEEVAEDRSRLWHQSDLLVERCGIALDIDREAHVALPDLAQVEVVARAPDRFARATIRRSNGEHQKLELLPDAPLTVRVVDAEGRRCGELPVVLDVVLLNTGSPRPSSRSRSLEGMLAAGRLDLLADEGNRLLRAAQEGLWRGTTSKSDGEAIVSHGPELILAWSDPDLVARRTALRFRLALPTATDATALVDPKMDFHQPVVLVAPPLAKLLVSVVGPDGRPYPYEVNLTSRIAPPAAKNAGQPGANPTPGSPQRGVIASALDSLQTDDAKPFDTRPTGTAVSKGVDPVEMTVPAGATIEIEAQPVDGRFKAAKTTATASVTPGDSGEVTVNLEQVPARHDAAPRVVGRALDPDGRPLADARIGWDVVDPHRHERLPGLRPSRFVSADLHGRFALSLPVPVHGQRAVSIRLFARCSKRETGVGPTMTAEVDLVDPDRKSDLDLGDVQLHRMATLLAGRVVDPEGRGLPHPMVSLWARSTKAEGSPDATFIAGRNGDFSVCSDTDERWLRVQAELDGWFMPGTTIDPRGALDVPTVSVAVGTTDFRLELHRCGEARGELLLAPGVDPSAILLEPVPPTARRVVREDGGRFRLLGLPGVTELAVLGSGRCLLTSIDRIELREGVETDDPRLQPLDATGVVQMPVQIVDPGGAPIPGATMALSSGSDRSREPETIRADPFGREVIVAVLNDGPLFVVAPDLRLERVNLESIAKTVKLAPGIRVSVTLQGIVDAPAEGFVSLSATLRPDRFTPPAVAALLDRARSRSQTHPLTDPAIDLVVSAPGTYSLTAIFSARDQRPSELYLGSLGRVADTKEAQTFTVSLPADAMTWAFGRREH